MKKYTNVDIIAQLQKLVDRYVQYYKEDFDMDRRLIARAAQAELPEDRTLIWFCRKCGTQCLRESQTFIRDSREHTTLRFYAEQSGEDITARIVVPKQINGQKIMGDVFEVDFKNLAFKVAQDAVQPISSRIAFADGFVAEVPFQKSLRGAQLLVQEHGKISTIHVIPADKEALAGILAEQKQRRERLPEGAKGEQLAALPAAEYRKYQAVKQEHPSALVCYAHNGYFELYGEDARKAAPILGTKLLLKNIRGQEAVPVTGFKETAWVSGSHKLWKTGADVFLSKDGAVFKDLKAADYIPVGATLEVGMTKCRIDAVDFAADKVTLTNLEVPDRLVQYSESIAYVRGFVEDAGTAIYDTVPKQEPKAPDQRASIHEKLTTAKKAQPNRMAAPSKSKRKDLER